MPTSKVFLNYTDWHEVDEDERTILVYGCMWLGDRATSDGTGIYRRDMYDPVDHASYTVASSNMKNSQIIRIRIMSTKT